MKIMVFDVPAEHGGALSILKQYYGAACSDLDNEWIFVVSKPELAETENVKVIRFPWIKKSWWHRLFFDNFYVSSLIKKHNPDKIISLQNVLVKGAKCFQELYVHQALPFCKKRFSLSENKTFWIYQNVISKSIFKSIKKADSVIVQTKWFKDAICKRTGIEDSKITIVQPDIKVPEGAKYEKQQDKIFFYPANSAIYKNHNVIYRALKRLNDEGYSDFEVVLTINKPEFISEKYPEIEKYINFCGYISKEQVGEYYKKSVLLFPSYLETFGLPLLEAKLYGCPIIASDCEFSHEILDDYDGAEYFDPFDTDKLVDLMKRKLLKEI